MGADDDVVDAVFGEEFLGFGTTGVDFGDVFFSLGVVEAVGPKPAGVAGEDLAAGEGGNRVEVVVAGDKSGIGGELLLDCLGKLQVGLGKHLDGGVGGELAD